MRPYRLLLRLLPASFREEYGEELTRVFAREWRDASGAGARVTLWLRALVDVIGTAVSVHVDMLRQDLRHAARSLRRAPGFSVATILVIALGVGATTAVFTLTDHVLLRPLPFPDSDRLVKIWQAAPTRPRNLRSIAGTNDVSPALYLGWKDLSKSFESMGAFSTASANLTGNGEPERLNGAQMSFDTLPTLGVGPALGRTFTADDDQSGVACVILISDSLWRRRFAAERSALGSRLRLDDETCEVIGIMPQRFDFPSRATQFWRPIRFDAAAASNFGNNYLAVIAKLHRSVSFEQARDELEALAPAIEKRGPDQRPNARAAMIELRDEINSQSRTLLVAIAGAAACLLLIACTNLASLTIARATTRSRELAVRTALGAGRRRLTRQMLTESVVLAVLGGAVGIMIAIAAIPTVVRLVPTALPIAETPAADLRMLAIATLATLGTGIGFGVFPALRAARRVTSDGLRESSRTGSNRRTTRVRSALVVIQVAASIVLLVGAGLLIRALMRVQATPVGFSSDSVLTMRTFLPWAKYGPQSKRTEFYRQVLNELHALPGVKAVAYTSYLPMTMRGGVWPVTIPGRPVNPERPELASSRFVTPSYFDAMGIPLLAGRAFAESDSVQAQPVAIVSQSFVTDYLGGGDAIGQTFDFLLAGTRSIVGVVGDVKFRGLERSNEPQVYLPHQQQGDNRAMGYVPKDLVIRLDSADSDRSQMDALVPAIRRIVRNADPDQPISDVRPLSAILGGEVVGRVVQVRVLVAFAALSLLLAAVGLHGLLAFVVSARTREFGVRLALGAKPQQILTQVARKGLVLGMVGVGVGLVAAYGVGRWLESVLAGVSPADGPTLAVASVVSLTICLIGSLIPALRASRTNPRQAIQAE
ncbi:MAG TPA: ABC transporter permease [Vicinamibacterales bacterium]|nr:ABC transporter permease [Vicinamibacterales bacterium]